MTYSFAVFDMEGTLSEPHYPVDSREKDVRSLWTYIVNELGGDALEQARENYNKWNNGGYDNYIEWVEDTIEIHKQAGLTKSQFYSLIDNITYREGVYETFEELHRRDIRTAIITGGFKEQANKIQRECGVHHVFASCEYMWDENGKIDGWNVLPTDQKGKQVLVKHLLNSHGLREDDFIFVGDGANDIDVAEQAGLSFGIDPDDSLREVVDYTIQTSNGETIQKILDYV